MHIAIDRTELQQGLAATERAALVLFLAMLPLFESPKAIAVTVFLGAAAGRHLLAPGPLRRPGALEAALLVLVATALLSGLAALVAGIGPPGAGPLRGAGEVALAAAVFIAVYRGGYGDGFRVALLWVALGAAAATAVAGALFQWLPAESRFAYAVLMSLGNANTATLYLGTCMACGLVLAVAAWRGRRWWQLAAAGAAVLAATAAFLFLGSRNATLALAVAVLALVVLGSGRARLPVAGLALAVVVGVVTLTSPSLTSKFQRVDFGSVEGILGARTDFWELGWAMFLDRPVLGAGWRNFGRVDAATLGFDFQPGTAIAEADHAHNQYLNVLAEGGVLGFAAYVAVLGVAALALWRRRPAAPGDRAVVWSAGVAAWIMIVVGGLFEVSFRAEVAMLAMTLLALALGPGPADAGGGGAKRVDRPGPSGLANPGVSPHSKGPDRRRRSAAPAGRFR